MSIKLHCLSPGVEMSWGLQQILQITFEDKGIVDPWPWTGQPRIRQSTSTKT